MSGFNMNNMNNQPFYGMNNNGRPNGTGNQPMQNFAGQGNNINLSPAQLAQFNEFRNQALLQQQQQQRQNAGLNPQQAMGQSTVSPQMAQQVLAAVNQRQNVLQPPSSSGGIQQPTPGGLSIQHLPTQIQSTIQQSGQLNPQQQAAVLRMLQAQAQSQGRQTMNATQMAQAMSVLQQSSQRVQSRSGTPNNPGNLQSFTSPQIQHQQAPLQPPQTITPSMMTTPPLSTAPARMPSPPRPPETRRLSIPISQAFDSSAVRRSASPAPAGLPVSSTIVPSSAFNPLQPTFKLDDSKLKKSKPQGQPITQDSSTFSVPPPPISIPTPAPASSSAPPPSSTLLPDKKKARPAKKKPTTGGSSPAVYFTAVEPTLRDESPQVEVPPQRQEQPIPQRTVMPTHAPVAAPAEPRRRGTEGMRGSMRNEIARLMYAAGDVLEPNVDAVDYVEDLVVEFLSDLCRPVPPIRPNPQFSHTSIPLTSSIIRHRLSRPALRKYLDRFETMSFIWNEVARTKREIKSTESAQDLIKSVGPDYLGLNEVAPEVRRRGRPKNLEKKRALAPVVDGDADEKKERRKPGPKKGWKAALAASGMDSPDTKRVDADGRKIKRPYKRRKKEGTADMGMNSGVGSSPIGKEEPV